MCTLSSDHLLRVEATRYTNPIKRKYRQKRLAAEGMYFFLNA